MLVLQLFWHTCQMLHFRTSSNINVDTNNCSAELSSWCGVIILNISAFLWLYSVNRDSMIESMCILSQENYYIISYIQHSVCWWPFWMLIHPEAYFGHGIYIQDRHMSDFNAHINAPPPPFFRLNFIICILYQQVTLVIWWRYGNVIYIQLRCEMKMKHFPIRHFIEWFRDARKPWDTGLRGYYLSSIWQTKNDYFRCRLPTTPNIGYVAGWHIVVWPSDGICRHRSWLTSSHVIAEISQLTAWINTSVVRSIS